MTAINHFKHLHLVVLALGLVGGSALSTTLSPFSATKPIIGVRVQLSKATVLSRHRQHHVHPHRNDVFVPSSTALHATSSSAGTSPRASDSKNTLIATLLLVLMDVQLRSLFTKYSIAFPSSLAGCGALFASMIALDSLSGSSKWGQALYEMLGPGANLLAKWLPVFFVPGLITLPLASGLGNAYEVSSV
jgi:hypothetical protein